MPCAEAPVPWLEWPNVWWLTSPLYHFALGSENYVITLLGGDDAGTDSWRLNRNFPDIKGKEGAERVSKKDGTAWTSVWSMTTHKYIELEMLLLLLFFISCFWTSWWMVFHPLRWEGEGIHGWGECSPLARLIWDSYQMEMSRRQCLEWQAELRVWVWESGTGDWKPWDGWGCPGRESR